MNILKRFKVSLFDEIEYRKLDNFIKVKEKEGLGYYFDNEYLFNNDFAYAELLMIDVRSYRNLTFTNCTVKINETKNAIFLQEQKEAFRSKKMLISLLLYKYESAENVKSAMINIMNKKIVRDI